MLTLIDAAQTAIFSWCMCLVPARCFAVIMKVCVNMKFKEKQNGVYYFDGGYDKTVLVLECMGLDVFRFRGVLIRPNLMVKTTDGYVSLSDIQTAINLMEILKSEGHVHVKKLNKFSW